MSEARNYATFSSPKPHSVGESYGMVGTPRAVEDLSTLAELSQVLGVSSGLAGVVEMLAARMGLDYATLTLKDPDTGEFRIEESHGLPTEIKRRARYRAGEGVIGRVIEMGEPVIVPSVLAEPRFLHRAVDLREAGADYSYICVPIKVGDDVVGTLSAERRRGHDANLLEDCRLLVILSSMVALAVQLRLDARAERKRLEAENARLQHKLTRRQGGPSRLIGDDKRMQEVYAQIMQVGPSRTTVLIRGESGTGKELAAEAIHQASDRANKPLVKVNCAALPESIVESELFGHERGAFTGAVSTRKGRFELADGGTIFLDEVGDFSPATQVKLLRVLQEREFERLGGSKTLAVDIRIIAATNRDLEALVRGGLFREDLYYRLNVFEVSMPPLRERRSDILLLANHFVDKYAKISGKRVRRISIPAIDMLMAYHWLGNVCELENCIERAVLVTHDEVIRGHHLPPTLQTASATGTAHAGSLQAAVDALEKELLVEALKEHRGNKAAAARALGLTERVMGLRVEKHQIDPARYKR